jgi:hypothetical protein
MEWKQQAQGIILTYGLSHLLAKLSVSKRALVERRSKSLASELHVLHF